MARCGESFTRRQAGLTALLKKGRSGWTSVTTIEDAVVQDECRSADFKGRTILLCQASVGPQQGIMTDALCFVAADGGALASECPLRVTDVEGGGCFTNDQGTGRRTWKAEIKSWTPATMGGLPGARAEVSLATVSLKNGENMDPACEQAIRLLEKAPRETLHLELAFDGRQLALTPESRKLADRFSWVFE